MIRRSDIDDRVREWGLRDDVVEKDYVLGWVLWGIATEPVISERWIFKGGTCLKKCYIETYRFSEDLDFSVLAGAPVAPDDVGPVVGRVLARVSEESGVDFAAMAPRFRSRPGGSSTEGTVYYRGPRGAPTPASIKLDLTSSEVVVEPPMLRDVAHPYSDGFPSANRVHCYSAEELFAEKLRAMAERSRPRDLYDIINLFRRPEFSADAPRVRRILIASASINRFRCPRSSRLRRRSIEPNWSPSGRTCSPTSSPHFRHMNSSGPNCQRCSIGWKDEASRPHSRHFRRSGMLSWGGHRRRPFPSGVERLPWSKSVSPR